MPTLQNENDVRVDLLSEDSLAFDDWLNTGFQISQN